MRTIITQQKIEACYEVANKISLKRMSIQDAVDELRDLHEINENSARDYIRAYLHMLNGELFKRTLSAASFDYFLDKIEKSRGSDALKVVINAVQLHIDYYESTGKKQKLSKARIIVEKFKKNFNTLSNLEELEAEFSLSIERSLKDSVVDRMNRLQNAKKIPLKINAITSVFKRNPDVVAAVLYRASGVCEGCLNPAPFDRKSDGMPYLEVHHKKQLADGGEDTVENAIALCPNCHRKMHYGQIEQGKP